MSLSTFRTKLISFPRRKRNFAAFLLGVCGVAAMPPFFIFPLLIPSFVGLYWLLQSAITPKRAFADGWFWGWGYFMAGLYWICIALLTDAAKFGWLIPFTLLGLTGVIALFPAFAGLLFYVLRPANNHSDRSVLVFCFVWTFVEYLRGHLFTGFPWNLAGYAVNVSEAAMQMGSLFGIYGVTFFVVAVATIPGRLSSRHYVPTVLGTWLIFACLVGWGAWRLQQADHVPEAERFVPDVNLRLVQANIAQPHKWDPARQKQGMLAHIDLTRSEGFDAVTHVIWPETAVPYVLQEGSELLPILAKAAPAKGALITGGLRAEGEGESMRFWNSVVALDEKAHMAAVYDKRRLVPFGEFVPFRHYVPYERLLVGGTDFSEGSGPAAFNVKGLPPVRVLICYEAIFPGLAQEDLTRPAWLINVTNDAWFGTSTGPYQHFEMARMRAAEEGVPVIRAANTGISAVIDPYGRVLNSLPLNTSGVLDSRLPRPILDSTLYSRIK